MPNLENKKARIKESISPRAKIKEHTLVKILYMHIKNTVTIPWLPKDTDVAFVSMKPTSHCLFPIRFCNLPKFLQSYLFVSQPIPLPICVQFSASITMLRLQQQEQEFLDFLGHWSCFCYHRAHYVLLIPYPMTLEAFFPKREASPFPLTAYFYFFLLPICVKLLLWLQQQEFR